MENSSAGSLLSVALAVLAIVLGGAGLYFGMTANQRLGPLAETMEEGSGSAVRLERAITALESKLDELSTQQSQLQSQLERVRGSGSQTERAMQQLANGVRENRSEMVKLAGRVNELLASGATTTRPPAATSDREDLPQASDETGQEDAATDAPTTRAATYTIRAGDTFAKIANELGIGLNSLIEANPNVDPQRLQIGQEIRLPAN